MTATGSAGAFSAFLGALNASQVHLDALADTGDAYTAFHGWVLTCLWCPQQVRGRTKTEAVMQMQAHYDDVCGGTGSAGVIR